MSLSLYEVSKMRNQPNYVEPEWWTGSKGEPGLATVIFAGIPIAITIFVMRLLSRKVVIKRKKTVSRKIVSRLTKKCTCQGAGDFGVSFLRK